jgi:hypothetical protein
MSTSALGALIERKLAIFLLKCMGHSKRAIAEDDEGRRQTIDQGL